MSPRVPNRPRRSSCGSGAASYSRWRSTTCGRSVTRAGKRTEWDIFEAYDLAEGDRPTYAALARRYGVAETSVTNYLAWARRRLRALVTERLRGVTSSERELHEEMRRLWS